MYATAANVRREVAALARPPIRIAVSKAAAKYVKVQSGSGTTSWDPTLTPYMVEPMDLMRSRLFESVVFVGPARTGKTQALIDCFTGYMVTCDPSDTLVVQISQEKAKDFSKLRINRLHRNSPEIGGKLSISKQDDNVFEKYYRAGNVLKLGWPTVKQLSSSEFKYVLLTDYDRMPENIDGEGSPFRLGQKRTQTYLSRGMTLAESSPGREITDPRWEPRTPHEGPPASGIFSLYNDGDRRRLYWPCPHCGEYFMPLPGIEAFSFNKNVDLFGVTDATVIGAIGLTCTKCGEVIEEKHKTNMNALHIWVPEGCEIEREGETLGLSGEARKTKTASFWMPGAAAAYQSWESIIQRYLSALREYDITGSEEALKTTTNVDQGMAYLPRRLMSDTSAKDLENRAEDLVKRAVPEGARFLIANVDVQGSKFVVQVIGYGVGFESWLVDRFDIHNSARTQVLDGKEESLPLDPAGYVEDWNLIIDKVMKRRYPLADKSDRKMSILLTACDSGGKAGVTERAYAFWRLLRKKNLHRRFMLVKGERPAPNAKKPTIKKSFPDNTKRGDRKANARGEIPVWILNTTLLKDAVSADMKRAEPGARFMHYPDWLGNWFYNELTAETRTEKGWENSAGARNEAFDLYCYSKAAIHALLLENRMHEIDWTNPPAWAADWDNNNQIDFEVKEKTAAQPRPVKVSRETNEWIGTDDGDWI